MLCLDQIRFCYPFWLGSKGDRVGGDVVGASHTPCPSVGQGVPREGGFRQRRGWKPGFSEWETGEAPECKQHMATAVQGRSRSPGNWDERLVSFKLGRLEHVEEEDPGLGGQWGSC